MILRATEGLRIKHRKSDDPSVRAMDVIVARIPQSQVPECFMIREWEENVFGVTPLSQAPETVTKYSIIFKNYTLTLDNFEIANKLFEVFLGDFEDIKDQKLQDIVPEMYL